METKGKMTKKPQTRPYIQMSDGQPFYFSDAALEEIPSIDVIATHLSNIARFTGAVDYVVAQHSVLVSEAVEPEYALGGLLHDGSEFALGDVHKPLKSLPCMFGYREMEHHLQSLIFKRFGVHYGFSAAIKRADERVLATEVRDLRPNPNLYMLPKSVTPLEQRIKVWSHEEAKVKFLRRFNTLYKKS
jgi:hypothetical protein